MVARDLLNEKHPLHAWFINRCEKAGKEPTVRQARKMMQRFAWLREFGKPKKA